MAGITLAWLIGETIIVYRSVTRLHRPPVPGELLGASGFFALCALLAEYPPAKTTAVLLAFGIDLAALLEAPLVTPASQRGTPQGRQRTGKILSGIGGNGPASTGKGQLSTPVATPIGLGGTA